MNLSIAFAWSLLTLATPMCAQAGPTEAEYEAALKWLREHEVLTKICQTAFTPARDSKGPPGEQVHLRASFGIQAGVWEFMQTPQELRFRSSGQGNVGYMAACLHLNHPEWSADEVVSRTPLFDLRWDGKAPPTPLPTGSEVSEAWCRIRIPLSSSLTCNPIVVDGDGIDVHWTRNGSVVLHQYLDASTPGSSGTPLLKWFQQLEELAASTYKARHERDNFQTFLAPFDPGKDASWLFSLARSWKWPQLAQKLNALGAKSPSGDSE